MFKEQIKEYTHNKHLRNADSVRHILQATEDFLTYTNRDPACRVPETLYRVQGTRRLIDFIFNISGV